MMTKYVVNVPVFAVSEKQAKFFVFSKLFPKRPTVKTVVRKVAVKAK